MARNQPTRYNNKMISWILFGIMAFITVIYPFLVPNLRYQASVVFLALFGNIIQTIGQLCLFFGIIMFVFGLFTLLCSRANRGLQLMIYALFFIIVGSFLTGIDYLTFLSGRSAPAPSKGYT